MKPRNPRLPTPPDCRALERRGEACERERCSGTVCYGECCFPPVSMATVHFSGCHRHTQNMEYGHPWEEEWARAYANREERMAQAERDRWMAKPKRVIRGNYWPSKADRADLRVVS